MPRYTEAELATAKQRLAQAEGRANNPDKRRAIIERLRLEVSAIEYASRWQATATPEQLVQADLDDTLNGLYPKARARAVVEHDGQRFQLKVKPVSFSFEVPTGWSRSWSPTDLAVGEPPPRKQAAPFCFSFCSRSLFE
ncbi:hypothetical protein IVB30_41500 [Bradyrhizobium sp. 200]|uniref:hypothetical protein n=1 Tax=Bradyrhizobium sp. 200 TaxID=2782665 RepID=UPI001FFFE2D8|nr:hypothetical protein [Bradyrhizobium sp. 200]UPJ49343.1 hypothetical protein IVB30_41500 [Bradyrhizobium sp. 200]